MIWVWRHCCQILQIVILVETKKRERERGTQIRYGARKYWRICSKRGENLFLCIRKVFAFPFLLHELYDVHFLRASTCISQKQLQNTVSLKYEVLSSNEYLRNCGYASAQIFKKSLWQNWSDVQAMQQIMNTEVDFVDVNNYYPPNASKQVQVNQYLSLF